MKNIFLLLLATLLASLVCGQSLIPNDTQKKDIQGLIDKYSLAREKRDTSLLKLILTSDIDQLVSTGEWRNGMQAAVQGMLTSSANSPGTRTLAVDKIRLLTDAQAIVDCRYDIANPDGSQRHMWSTFIVVAEQGKWKISAIRNMLPAK